MQRFSVRSILTVLAAAFALAGCATVVDPKPPEVTLVDIRPAGGGLLNPRFDVALKLRNPNDFALPLQSVNFTLDVSGARFAVGDSTKAVTVPRGGEAVLPIRVEGNMLGIVGQLMTQGQTSEFKYSLNGVANFRSVFTVPVKFNRRGAISLGPPAGRS